MLYIIQRNEPRLYCYKDNTDDIEIRMLILSQHKHKIFKVEQWTF